MDLEQYDADFLEHRATSKLSMSFSGNNTIEVMAGFETRIIFGGESALLTPLDASDWDVIKAVTTPVIRAITKKCQRFYQSRILEESYPGICEGLSSFGLMDQDHVFMESLWAYIQSNIAIIKFSTCHVPPTM